MQRRAGQRILMEFNQINKNPEEGFAVTAEEPSKQWTVTMAGPEGSAFEGGQFVLDFVFENYPFKAPAVTFKTKIYHPNVDDAGEICHEIYEADWVPTKKVRSIMIVLKSLLVSPNPASPIREDIAAQYAEDYDNWVKTAQEWTQKYAT